jgi:hypothetical protein
MHKSLAHKFEGSRLPAENENYDISPKSWRMDLMIGMMKYPDISSKNSLAHKFEGSKKGQKSHKGVQSTLSGT